MSRRMFKPVLALLIGLFFLPMTVSGQDDTRLLRFPHVNGDKVVFTYAGDLYTAPLAGGTASRLTSHEGLEIFARFSPDGRWIVFSGEYAGTRQVYLIPSEGGVPKQLTYYPDVGAMPPRGGYDHLVVDWTPDGSRVLIRANRTPFGQRVGRYYLVDPWNGGLEIPLEIPEGATGATYDATGTKLAFNIKGREWRHWKRYRAGRQQDVWLYDLANHTSQRITELNSTDNFPLWVGDRVFFVSDRDENEKLNLWVYDTNTEQISQVTGHDEYDVMWPSRGEGGIVYENGGYIHHLDPATGESRRLSIHVPGDRPYTTPYFKNVSDNIESFEISPSGKRVVFGARGEIFTVPAEHGNIRNLSESPAHRERGVTWSPDGEWIAYLSDTSGDYDLYLMPADGSSEATRLVRGENTWIDGLTWSPDSKWIAWADNTNRLRAVDVESGRITEIDQTTSSGLSDFDWSGDSKWIAYSKGSENTMTAIWLYSFDSGRTTQVTGDMTDERSPAFDPQGRYLYFVSARDFQYQGYNSSFRSRIYAATLRGDVPHPFPPRSDEEPGVTDEDEEPEATVSGEGGDLTIELDGLDDRVVALPGVSPGGYQGLTGTDDGVLYFSGGGVHLYNMEDREAKEVLPRVNGYSLTPDRKQILYRTGRSDYGIVALRPGQSNESGRLDLDGMNLQIDPKVEWAQVFHDAWVIMRDWFYDPGLHGVDWDAMRDRYEPLLEDLAHRADLDYILAELVAEMNVGHAYVNSSPELPGPDRVDVGLLGAEFVADGRYYRISNIFPGENWHDQYRSPLTEPGIEVREGEFLIAIDGEEVTTDANPYSFLVGKAERVVEITVNDRPSRDGARSYQVHPVTSELGLRYQDWVAENVRLVDELSGGRIGYMHLPNTSTPGYRELFENLRPLQTREALIFDDRYNGGGFIPEPMAMVIAMPRLNFWSRRYLDLNSQPAVVHQGPKAVLINGLAASGGDAFPYYFRLLEQGPLIGETTWGGLVGISGNPGFVDGGGLSVPRFAFVDNEGNWAVEAEGVAPDPGFEVLDRPEEIAAGREPIIERAVQYLLQELEKPQYKKPDKPRGPIRRAGGGE